MPALSAYPDLDTLLNSAKASLARANALDASLPPGSNTVYNPPARLAAAPAPVDDSLWGRIKRVANASPLPDDIGDQFVNQVDPNRDRDAKALAGTYGPLDTLKSFLAGSFGGGADELRALGTPAGLASLASPETRGGAVVRGLSRAVSIAGSALFAGEGADDLAHAPDAGAKARGALNLLFGLHGLHGGIADLPTPGNRGPAAPESTYHTPGLTYLDDGRATFDRPTPPDHSPVPVASFEGSGRPQPLAESLAPDAASPFDRYAPNTSAVDHQGSPEHAADAIPPPSVAEWTTRQMADAGDTDLPFDSDTAPSARFAFHQDDFNGGSFPMFHIEGGPAHGSTVSAATLGEHGIPVPDVPAGTVQSPKPQGFDAAPPIPPAEPAAIAADPSKPRITGDEFANILRGREKFASANPDVTLPPGARDEIDRMGLEYGRTQRTLKSLLGMPDADPAEVGRMQQGARELGSRLRQTVKGYTAPPEPAAPSSLMDMLRASADAGGGGGTAPAADALPADRAGHFTLPQPSPRLQDRINTLLDARDRALGREPLEPSSTAPTPTPVDISSAPVVDATGRAIAPAQGDPLPERPAGPWSLNGTGEVPTPEPASPPPSDAPSSEAGFANPQLLAKLLRIPAGAAAGAVFDPENRTRGALLGGGLGAASLIPGLPEKAERLRYFSMLAGPAPVKKLISDTGVVLNTAGERAMTHGLAAGGNVLKEFFNPATVQDALHQVKTGGDPNTLMDRPSATSYAGVMGMPPRIMGAATEATTHALDRAGVEDAAARTFTQEPTTKTGQAALQFQRSSKLARLLLPFAKTAINQVEGGTVPIYKALSGGMADLDPAGRRQLLAKLGMLGVSGAAGAALGATDFPKDHPVLATLAPLLAGPGALEAGAAEALTHALHQGKNEPQALTAAAAQATHQLPTPSEWATNPSELLASLAPAGLRSLNPDPIDRDTSGSLFGALLKRLPWLSQTLPPKHRGNSGSRDATVID